MIESRRTTVSSLVYPTQPRGCSGLFPSLLYYRGLFPWRWIQLFFFSLQISKIKFGDWINWTRSTWTGVDCFRHWNNSRNIEDNGKFATGLELSDGELTVIWVFWSISLMLSLSEANKLRKLMTRYTEITNYSIPGAGLRPPSMCFCQKVEISL